MTERRLEPRVFIVDWIISSLTDFANEEYQRRVWLDGLGPEVDCFADAMHHFFSACNVDEVLREWWAEWKLPPAGYPHLREVRDRVRAVADRVGWDPDVAALLRDPEWRAVPRAAQEALRVSAQTRIRPSRDLREG